MFQAPGNHKQHQVMMGGGSELLTQRGQKNEGRVKSDQPGAEPRDCRSWLWGISLLSLLRTESTWESIRSESKDKLRL